MAKKKAEVIAVKESTEAEIVPVEVVLAMDPSKGEDSTAIVVEVHSPKNNNLRKYAKFQKK